MAKTKVSEWSATPGNNTDIDSINIAEGCAPSGINDAIRELMAQIKDYQTGTYSDTFNGPVNGTVGATTPSTGAFTTLSSTGNTTLGNDSGDTVTVNGATTFVNVNPTLSQGTANGVLYLNGSKVATSGSALTFDGTNLGVGVTPASDGAIHVHRNGASFPTIKITNGTTGTGNTDGFDLVCGSGGEAYVYNRENQPLIFGTNNSEVMRLTSTGLGIGTSSPTGRLDVNTTAGEVIYSSSDRSTNGQYISGLIQRAKNSSSSYVSYAAVYGSITSNTASSEAGALTFWTMSSGSVAERMRLDSSGNLGIGVTPSGTTRLQVLSSGNNLAYFQDASASGVQYAIATNGSGQIRHFATWANSGVDAYHSWYVTTTAGAQPQAMTLDASGNLGVGTTSPSVRLNVTDSADGGNSGTIRLGSDATYYAQHQFRYNSSEYRFGTYGAGQFMSLYTAGSERARIDSSGNLLVNKNTTSQSTAGTILYGGGSNNAAYFTGTDSVAVYVNRETSDGTVIDIRRAAATVGSISVTASATAYNTSSDYRLKDNQQPLIGSGAFIDALQPKTWNWKSDGSKGVGFIAHEVQAVSPGSVVGEKDGEQMQAMEYGSAEFIANIIAELQSLRARVAQLESN